MAGVLIVSGRRTLGQFEGDERSAINGDLPRAAQFSNVADRLRSLRVFSAISAIKLLARASQRYGDGVAPPAIESALPLSALEFSKTPTSPRAFYDRRYRDYLKHSQPSRTRTPPP